MDLINFKFTSDKTSIKRQLPEYTGSSSESDSDVGETSSDKVCESNRERSQFVSEDFFSRSKKKKGSNKKNK